MKDKYLEALQNIINESLSAHVLAKWDDSKTRDTIASLIVKKFAKYMKDQKELDKLGMTEEDAMIPPSALGIER